MRFDSVAAEASQQPACRAAFAPRDCTGDQVDFVSLRSLFARSLIFNALFYVNMIVRMIVALPTLVLPLIVPARRSCARYARTSLWLLRVVCGITVEWRGREKIPQGACIVACKHQSAVGDVRAVRDASDPAFVLKRELMWIPLFGWLARAKPA